MPATGRGGIGVTAPRRLLWALFVGACLSMPVWAVLVYFGGWWLALAVALASFLAVWLIFVPFEDGQD